MLDCIVDSGTKRNNSKKQMDCNLVWCFSLQRWWISRKDCWPSQLIVPQSFATLFSSITTTNRKIKKFEVFALSPSFQMIIILHTEFVVDSSLSLLSHSEIGNGIAYYLRFENWLTFTFREFCSMSHLYSFGAFAWNISTAFGEKRNKWLTHVGEKKLKNFSSLFCYAQIVRYEI